MARGRHAPPPPCRLAAGGGLGRASPTVRKGWSLAKFFSPTPCTFISSCTVLKAPVFCRYSTMRAASFVADAGQRGELLRGGGVDVDLAGRRGLGRGQRDAGRGQERQGQGEAQGNDPVFSFISSSLFAGAASCGDVPCVSDGVPCPPGLARPLSSDRTSLGIRRGPVSPTDPRRSAAHAGSDKATGCRTAAAGQGTEADGTATTGDALAKRTRRADKRLVELTTQAASRRTSAPTWRPSVSTALHRPDVRLLVAAEALQPALDVVFALGLLRPASRRRAAHAAARARSTRARAGRRRPASSRTSRAPCPRSRRSGPPARGARSTSSRMTVSASCPAAARAG